MLSSPWLFVMVHAVTFSIPLTFSFLLIWDTCALYGVRMAIFSGKTFETFIRSLAIRTYIVRKKNGNWPQELSYFVGTDNIIR